APSARTAAERTRVLPHQRPDRWLPRQRGSKSPRDRAPGARAPSVASRGRARAPCPRFRCPLEIGIVRHACRAPLPIVWHAPRMTKPLVPEDLPRYTTAARENTINSFVRSVISVAMGKLDRNVGPEAFARKTWPGDRNVPEILRAATAPATIATSGPLAQVTAAFLPALTPVSAGADLLQRVLGLSFSGHAQINLPSIGPVIADFVGEGAPIPVQQALTGPGTSLFPHKLAVVSSLTREMMESSNAEAMVKQVLVESTGPAIDKVLFSANAAAPD